MMNKDSMRTNIEKVEPKPAEFENYDIKDNNKAFNYQRKCLGTNSSNSAGSVLTVLTPQAQPLRIYLNRQWRYWSERRCADG